MANPMFSVVMATYGRGRHIAPSIESVLRQSFDDFELIVVGDGPDYLAEAAVRSFGSPKVRWSSLLERSGSQSGPNNCGIAESAGEWIAYLGHDDIWSGRHLEEVAKTIARSQPVEVVVSGCLYHAPPGSRIAWVTGLSGQKGTRSTAAFPPSSIAHRRTAISRVGGWRPAETLTAPVDEDVTKRFADAGFRFTFTGCLTVHKFAAGHRYLSYLRQSSEEQSMLLKSPAIDDADGWRALIDLARVNGGFDTLHADQATDVAPGHRAARSRKNRGVDLQLREPLDGGRTIPQDDDPRGLDWYGLEQGEMPFRWSGPNPRPKILLPVLHDGPARVTLAVVEYKGDPTEITATADGHSLRITARQHGGRHHLDIDIDMTSATPNVIELHTPTMFRPFDDRDDGPRLGIAVGDLSIRPNPEP